jgi:hypothetical protein
VDGGLRVRGHRRWPYLQPRGQEPNGRRVQRRLRCLRTGVRARGPVDWPSVVHLAGAPAREPWHQPEVFASEPAALSFPIRPDELVRSEAIFRGYRSATSVSESRCSLTVSFWRSADRFVRDWIPFRQRPWVTWGADSAGPNSAGRLRLCPRGSISGQPRCRRRHPSLPRRSPSKIRSLSRRRRLPIKVVRAPGCAPSASSWPQWVGRRWSRAWF